MADEKEPRKVSVVIGVVGAVVEIEVNLTIPFDRSGRPIHSSGVRRGSAWGCFSRYRSLVDSACPWVRTLVAGRLQIELALAAFKQVNLALPGFEVELQPKPVDQKRL